MALISHAYLTKNHNCLFSLFCLTFQLKPVRSLENFKQTSPVSSPERWIFPPRSGAPIASPPNRLFLPSYNTQETQNLLQSPDDVFSSPPVPPPRVPTRDTTDLFGTAPFIVGGGHSENGDPLFLVASHNAVDVVKLSPPTASPRHKVNMYCLHY